MNILYCDRFSTESLSATHVYEVLSNLSKLGHNVIPLYASSQMLRAEPGVVAHEPSLLERIKIYLRSSWFYRRFRGEILVLYRLFRELCVFVSALRLVAKQRKNIEVIYRRHNLINSEFIISRLFRIPLVKEVNGIIADEVKIAQRGGNFSLLVLNIIERLNMPKADKIIAVTARLKDVLRDNYCIPEDRVVVIWNGANTDLFHPTDITEARKKLGLDLDGSYVCFVGSLSKWQGVEYLIQSAPQVLVECPGTRFLIVGDGMLKQELITMTKNTGVSDNFLFTGFVSYDKVPLYINASDIRQ